MIKTVDIRGKDTKVVLTGNLAIVPILSGNNIGFCHSYRIIHLPTKYIVGDFCLRDTPVKALRTLRKLNWNFSDLKHMPYRTQAFSNMITRELKNAETEILNAFCIIEKYFGVSADVLINLAQNHGRTTKTTRADSYSQKPVKPGR
jgi:hypothetical protein